MHVLAITIQEIAMGLAAARPDPNLWRGDAARAYAGNLDALIHDLMVLGHQLGAHSFSAGQS